MHFYFVNGLLVSLALVVIGYFIVAVVRTAWTTSRISRFFLLLAEGILTLVLFGIVDYPGGYPLLWWIIVLWMSLRAAWLHKELTYGAPEDIRIYFDT